MITLHFVYVSHSKYLCLVYKLFIILTRRKSKPAKQPKPLIFTHSPVDKKQNKTNKQTPQQANKQTNKPKVVRGKCNCLTLNHNYTLSA